MAFTLRQVERFEITLGPSTTLFDHTLATTLLDTSKTFLLYGWRSDSNDADSEYGSCRIISASQIRAERSGPASSITFIGYVCEFTAGVAVIRGSTSMFSGPDDVNVSSVITDLSKSWCRAHQRDQGGGGTVAEDDFSSGELVDAAGTETLRLHREAAVSDIVDWECVQFDDCTVQRGTVTLASGATSDTLSITAVDQSRTFLLCGVDQEGQSGGGGRMDILLPRVRLTADDTVTVDRASSGAAVNVRVQVIEFTAASGITVQKLSSAFAAADGQNDHALTPLGGLDKAAATCSVNGSTGKTDYSASDIAGEAFFTPELTSTTNLQVKRNSTNGAADVEVYVIDFAPPGGGGGAVLPGTLMMGMG